MTPRPGKTTRLAVRSWGGWPSVGVTALSLYVAGAGSASAPGPTGRDLTGSASGGADVSEPGVAPRASGHDLTGSALGEAKVLGPAWAPWASGRDLTGTAPGEAGA